MSALPGDPSAPASRADRAPSTVWPAGGDVANAEANAVPIRVRGGRWIRAASRPLSSTPRVEPEGRAAGSRGLLTRVAHGAEQQSLRTCVTAPFHVEPTDVTGQMAAWRRPSRGGEWWSPRGPRAATRGPSRRPTGASGRVCRAYARPWACARRARRWRGGSYTEPRRDDCRTARRRGSVGRRATSGGGIAHPGVRTPWRSRVPVLEGSRGAGCRSTAPGCADRAGTSRRRVPRETEPGWSARDTSDRQVIRRVHRAALG